MIEAHAGIDVGDHEPALPVVMPHADTASVAARSMVACPSSVIGVELGVSMYHWPFAGPSSSGWAEQRIIRGHRERVAALVDRGELHRRIGPQPGERGLDVGAIERLLQEQHVHVRRDLARAREREARPARRGDGIGSAGAARA